MAFVVAIDGPAGTGKSSVARLVAQKLQFIYVDTGALYRALALLANRRNVSDTDDKGLVKIIDDITIAIDEQFSCTRIEIDGSVVEQELRTENISRLASIISQHPQVRQRLLGVLRDLVHSIKQGAIFEGRDIGTVVFPKAPVKVFITANSRTRAQRRYDEIKRSGAKANFDEILEAIEKRDERDKTRATAPMLQAHDAYVIDTSTMTIDEVVAKTIEIIANKKNNFGAGGDVW